MTYLLDTNAISAIMREDNDLWMAATALAIDATLVTRDSDFREIDGLAVVAL